MPRRLGLASSVFRLTIFFGLITSVFVSELLTVLVLRQSSPTQHNPLQFKEIHHKLDKISYFRSRCAFGIA